MSVVELTRFVFRSPSWLIVSCSPPPAQTSFTRYPFGLNSIEQVIPRVPVMFAAATFPFEVKRVGEIEVPTVRAGLRGNPIISVILILDSYVAVGSRVARHPSRRIVSVGGRATVCVVYCR